MYFFHPTLAVEDPPRVAPTSPKSILQKLMLYVTTVMSFRECVTFAIG